MEINKQLFEDVILGKLKGTFIRRDGVKLSSSLLIHSGPVNDRFLVIGPESDMHYIYHDNGTVRTYPYKSDLDIIDFIPATNMKENELTIEIPNGKEVDWDESKKQNKIVLKDKQLTYKYVCEKLFENKPVYYIAEEGNIFISNISFSELEKKLLYNSSNATTKHQLECLLAKNKLANVAKYLNDGWKPSCKSKIFILVGMRTDVLISETAKGSYGYDCGSIWFKSRETAQQAIEILGEETVKLALEPLGI